MRQSRIIFPVLAANSYHQASLIALVPVLLDVFQVDIQVMGLLAGAALAVSGIALPVWGFVADKRGFHSALRTTFVCALVAVTLLGISVALSAMHYIAPILGFAGFLLGRFIYCLSAPAVLPMGQALSAHTSPANLLGAVARLNIANSFGRIAGNLSVFLLLALGGGAAIVIAAPLPVYMFCLWKNRTAVTGDIKIKEATLPAKLEVPGAMVLRFVAACMVQLSIGLAYFLIGPLIQQALNVDARTSSGMVGFCLAVAIIANLVANAALKPWLGRRQWMGQLIAALAGASGLLLIATTTSYLQIVLAVIMLSIAAAVFFSINITQALLQVPDALAARTSTLLSSAQFWGLAVGTSLGGFLGQISFQLAYMTGAACFLFAGLMAAMLTFGQQRGFVTTSSRIENSTQSH